MGKLRSLLQLHFVLPILFVLTLASDRAVLYRNVALSILVLSTKKQHSNFLEKFFVFLKICCKVKVLNTLKISSNCYLKTYQSLKRRKIPSNLFQQNLCFFCWPQNEVSQKKRFLYQDKNQLKFRRKTCWKGQLFIFCLFDE